MIDTDYARGLEKLGLYTPYLIDLRTDPAFAWRVLERFAVEMDGIDCIISYKPWSIEWETEHEKDGGLAVAIGDNLADVLHAAVCALGREE